MKKITGLLIVFCTAPLFMQAQNKAVHNFQEKYRNDRDATYVAISRSLFRFISEVAEDALTGENTEADQEMQALARVANGITSLKILIIPKYESGLKAQEIDNLKSSLEKDNYEVLMSVKEGSRFLYFMAQGNENELRNMLVLIDDKDEFTLLNIDGTLTTKDLSYLTKNRHNWH